MHFVSVVRDPGEGGGGRSGGQALRVDDGLEARIIRDLHVRIDDVLRNCPLQYVHIINLHLCTVKFFKAMVQSS